MARESLFSTQDFSDAVLPVTKGNNLFQDDSDTTSQNAIQLYNLIVNVYVDGVLCILGFFGNVMTILVLRKSGTRTSNSILLQALAILDTCFLIYVVIYVVLRSAGFFQDISPYIVAFVLPFGWTSQTGTIWMVMAIAIDRFLIVSRPLKATQWCTPNNAVKAAIGVILSAVIFNLPRWPRYYFRAFGSESVSNSTFVSHLDAAIDGWDDNIYRKVYHISLTFIFLFCIPLAIIIALNIGLIYYLKKATKLRATMTQKKKDDGKNKENKSSNNVTFMMIIMITLFVICELPDFIASVIGAGQFQVDPILYEYYAGIKEALLVFNSAGNFYIYCLFYKRFGMTLKKLFGCSKDNGGENSTLYSKTTYNSTMSVSTISQGDVKPLQ